MKLGVVVGHTHEASGATLCRPFDFVSEYEFNTLIAAMMMNYGRTVGVDVFVALRDNIGISGAHKAVANAQCKACIELHFNSFNSTTEGTETLYGEINGSKEFAEIVQAHMVSVYERKDAKNRGIKFVGSADRGGGNVNQPSKLPTVLVEPFFGSDPDEAALALNKMPELARCLVDAAKKFIGTGK